VTDVLAARPTPLSRVWSGSKIIAEDIEGDDLGDVLQLHTDASAWWVMSRSDGEAGRELRRAANALDLDELAIRELLADDHRAKYEELGQARLVMTNAVSVDQETVELTACPVSLVVTDRAIICLVHPSSRNDFNPAQLLSQRDHQLADGGVEHAFQFVLGAVVKTYEDAVEWLEDQSDELAEALFDERPLDKGEQIRAFRLRTAVSRLRRMTDPMRTVMDELVAEQPPGTTTTRTWELIAQQHHRVANAADALREALASSFDTSLALADLRMNTVMKRLTGWAGIVAVPTLVTGFAGMNVNFPLDGTSVGFWLYFLVMLVAVVVLYVIFRRKDWV
jgi:magnesium transporter